MITEKLSHMRDTLSFMSTSHTPSGTVSGNRLMEADKSMRLMQALAVEAGDPLMPLQQLALLVILYTQGEMSQASLDGQTNVTGKATNSRNLIKLGTGNRQYGPGLELVEQVEDLLDKRAKRIRLTPKGRAVMERALAKALPNDTASFPPAPSPT
ncbi:hypothetical protein GNX71_18640 [Variovorax sp. RKNM96]|uniref:MarR family winged helix-turn-helix transcriptional regulator n=1 Tax=Variovorax sp. RKNM96 TaxID=2681552 RepID=UPI00197F4BA8|nr:MarR family winged helix-turn-helix transcriptional regulator [Variovorax sp. RKNM96]QSI31486.1 hypothetical protein GNX71_18640 [Variovorax sp. RKNM96]